MEFEDKEALKDKIAIITSQTNYTQEEAKYKLSECNGDHIKVIKNFMGIEDKKEKRLVSVNQEIYRQLRHKMDDSVRDYNKKQQDKLAYEIAKNQE